MTANGTKQRKKGKTNPLVALEPLVVLDTNEHAVSVVLGADSVTRSQRDAAIKYLNKVLGGNSSTVSGAGFKLDVSSTNDLYRLSGTTKLYVGSPEFAELVEGFVQPKFVRKGELTLDIVREDTRHMVGVEGVIVVSGRGTLKPLPELGENPSEVIGLVHSGSSIAFSLKNLVKTAGGKPRMATDAELIDDALRVATAFGVYVDKPPRRVTDPDPRARLYPRFNLPEAGGEG